MLLCLRWFFPHLLELYAHEQPSITAQKVWDALLLEVIASVNLVHRGSLFLEPLTDLAYKSALGLACHE